MRVKHSLIVVLIVSLLLASTQLASAINIVRMSVSDAKAASYLSYNPFAALSSANVVSNKAGESNDLGLDSDSYFDVSSAGASFYVRPPVRVPYRPSLRSTYRPPLY